MSGCAVASHNYPRHMVVGLIYRTIHRKNLGGGGVCLQPGANPMISLVREMARAFRRSRPTFLALTLTLALGVAVNTALLSLVRTMFVTTVPLPDARRVVQFSAVPTDWKPGDFTRTFSLSWLNLQDIRAATTTLKDFSPYFAQPLTWTGAGEPRLVAGAGVSADFFKALGAAAWRGRLPTADEIDGLRPVAVVSHRFWQRHLAAAGEFGASTTPLTLNGVPHEVIGVLPPRVELPLQNDIWVPLQLTEVQRTNRSNYTLSLVARLVDGASLEQAQTELNAITGRLAKEHPSFNADWRNIIFPLRESLLFGNERSVLTLQAGAFLLLVMAMFNLAILLYAQAAQRAQESAVRLALGASARRLARESLLTTTAVLVPGIALGLLGAGWALPVLGTVNPVPVLGYFFEDQSLSWPVALASSGLALGLGWLAGLLPAWQSMSANTASVLRENLRGGSLGPTVLRTQRWLMQGQLAVTTALLFAAIVLGLSYHRLVSTDLGYHTDDRTTFTFSLPVGRYGDIAAQQRFARQFQDRLKAEAWVRDATVTANLPVGDTTWSGNFSPEPTPGAQPQLATEGYYRITETFLDTMGLTLLRGRNITARDNASAPRVVLVSEALARKYWPSKDAVGERLWRRRAGQIEISEVVGVVSDSVVGSPRTGVQPLVFLPLEQTTLQGLISVVIRSELDTATVLRQAKAALWSLDPNLTTTNEGAFAQRVERAVAIERFQSLLVLGLGTFGLAISLLGLAGLAIRILGARQAEFAVRSALGATPGSIMRLLLWQQGRMVAGGAALGLAGTWALVRLGGVEPYGVSLANPAPYVGAVAVLLALALLSLLGPVLHAARANPANVLRT